VEHCGNCRFFDEGTCLLDTSPEQEPAKTLLALTGVESVPEALMLIQAAVLKETQIDHWLKHWECPARRLRWSKLMRLMRTLFGNSKAEEKSQSRDDR